MRAAPLRRVRLDEHRRRVRSDENRRDRVPALARQRQPARPGRAREASRRWKLALACLVAVAAAPSAAHAYCRKSACDGAAGTRCAPARTGDCGVPLAWPGGRVRVQLAEPVAGVDRARAQQLLERAFAAWASADCGGGAHPAVDLALDPGAPNRARFTDDAPPDLGTLALATLVFDPGATGDLRRADLAFYARTLRPYLDGPELESIALHEVGHLLGLAHANDERAVMAGEVEDGAFRAGLSEDDRLAICVAYPPRIASRDTRSQSHGCRWVSVGTAAICAGVAIVILWRIRVAKMRDGR